MLDTKLIKTGTILMHEGLIHIAGFDAEDCMCRELAAHALLWAIGEMQRELSELIARPGGTGNTVMDLPAEVSSALGLTDPWDDDQGQREEAASARCQFFSGRRNWFGIQR